MLASPLEPRQNEVEARGEDDLEGRPSSFGRGGPRRRLAQLSLGIARFFGWWFILGGAEIIQAHVVAIVPNGGGLLATCALHDFTPLTSAVSCVSEQFSGWPGPTGEPRPSDP